MAKKLSKADREELDEAVRTLRQALKDALQQQEDDDKCEKTLAAQSDSAAIKAAADRDGMKGGILMARALGKRGGPQE